MLTGIYMYIYEHKLYTKSMGDISSERVVIKFAKLFKEDEGENSVWAKSSVVWSEPFPQTKETFLLHQLSPHILQGRK